MTAQSLGAHAALLSSRGSRAPGGRSSSPRANGFVFWTRSYRQVPMVGQLIKHGYRGIILGPWVVFAPGASVDKPRAGGRDTSRKDGHGLPGCQFPGTHLPPLMPSRLPGKT